MSQQKVDLSRIIHLASDIVCEVCGNYTFQEVVLMKKFSAVVSPTGQEIIAPMPVFACNACGNINKEFLPNLGPQEEPAAKPRISLDA